MNYTYAQKAWNDPHGDMVEAFHHVSYAVFRLDSDRGEILCARCPDLSALPVGHSLAEVLELSPEALAGLAGGRGDDRIPIFVMTRLGLGILIRWYDRYAGLGLYLHIHADAAACARLINSGALGVPETGLFSVTSRIRAEGSAVTRRDMASYDALADAWSGVRRYVETGIFGVDGDGMIYRREMEETLGRIADFAGCGIELASDEASERISILACYRPPLLEILMLCLLTEVRSRSATRGCILHVSAVNDEEGGGLSLSIRYPLELNSASHDLWTQGHRHLGVAAEVAGLSLSEVVAQPSHSLRSAGALPEMQISLEWLHNPALLPSSDLKSMLRLVYGGGEKSTRGFAP